MAEYCKSCELPSRVCICRLPKQKCEKSGYFFLVTLKVDGQEVAMKAIDTDPLSWIISSGHLAKCLVENPVRHVFIANRISEETYLQLRDYSKSHQQP